VLAASSGRFFPAGVVPASARRSPAQEDRASGLAADGIPDAAGLSARQALVLFARRGIAVRLEGTGFVEAQRPPAGAAWQPGSAVILSLSEDAAAVSRSGRGREETPSATPGP
jgi:PASTA domain